MAVILKPELIPENRDYEHIWEKYRFGENLPAGELKNIWCMAQAHPVICFGEKPGEKEMLYVAATLGEAYDRYIGSLEDHDELLRAYAADCIGMELLGMLGRYLEDKLFSQGLAAGTPVYLQPGEDLNEALKLLDAEITVNEAGMMKPLKSVVYKMPVRKKCSESRPERHGTCSGCEQNTCPYREDKGEEKSSRGEPGAFKYSYGYQRIFGK